MVTIDKYKYSLSYGVPYEVESAVNVLLSQRKEATETILDVIDGAIIRLLEPWVNNKIEDLGSLLPLDVGFDVRKTDTSLSLPLKPGVIYTIKYGGGAQITGTAEEICSVLTKQGYKIQIPLPKGFIQVSTKNSFLVNPKGDLTIVACANLSQALTAYEYPELYEESFL